MVSEGILSNGPGEPQSTPKGVTVCLPQGTQKRWMVGYALCQPFLQDAIAWGAPIGGPAGEVCPQPSASVQALSNVASRLSPGQWPLCDLWVWVKNR